MKIVLVFFIFMINIVFADSKISTSVMLDKNKLNYNRGDVAVISVVSPYDSIEGHVITHDSAAKKLYVDFIIANDNLDFGVPLGFTYSVKLQPDDYEPLFGGNLEENIILTIREYDNATAATAFPTGKVKFVTSKPMTITQMTYVNGQYAITDPTGAWYDPALNGVGFVLMQVENGSVMYYYGYDAAGKRLWLISEVIDETWIKGEAKTLVMYEGQADANTNFTTPPANAPGTVEWGKVEMRFDDCNSGFAKLSGADGEQTFTLTKLAVPGAVHCVKN